MEIDRIGVKEVHLVLAGLTKSGRVYLDKLQRFGHTYLA